MPEPLTNSIPNLCAVSDRPARAEPISLRFLQGVVPSFHVFNCFSKASPRARDRDESLLTAYQY